MSLSFGKTKNGFERGFGVDVGFGGVYEADGAAERPIKVPNVVPKIGRRI